MRTEEIMSRVIDAMKPFAVVETAKDSRDYNAESVMRDMHDKLRLLAADLEEQIRREIASAKGVGNAAKIISDMLKAELKTRPSLAYPWIDGEGRQCVCSGYEAYRLRDHLPLPERPEDAGEPIDLDKLLPTDLAGWKELPMPSANDLKSFITTERAKWTGKRKEFKAYWSFGQQAPTVNAEYLLHAATIFPDADKLFWNTLVSPLMIVSNHGDGAVLPVRDASKMQPAPASDDEREAIERDKAEQAKRAQEAQERAKIHKAHEDYTAAYEDRRKIEDHLAELHKQAKTVVGKDERNALANEIVLAFEASARARLREYAARSVFEPDCALEPHEFELIVKRLYARERLSA